MSDGTSRAYPSGTQEFKSGFSGVHVVCVVFTFFVPCCDICYDFRVKRCSDHLIW